MKTEKLDKIRLRIKMMGLQRKLITSKKWRYILSKYPNLMELDYDGVRAFVGIVQEERRFEDLRKKVSDESLGKMIDDSLEMIRKVKTRCIKKYGIQVRKGNVAR